MKWLCVQIGRREHYAIPRALRRNGEAVHLATDFWSPARGFEGIAESLIPSVMLDRRVDEEVGTVKAFNVQCLIHELGSRIKGGGMFKRALRRNEWFTACLDAYLGNHPVRADVVFAYSYAAAAAIRFARAQNIPFILGQIDGGLYEEEIIKRAAGYGKNAPASYWQAWRHEVAAADAVVVNSEWSAKCLERSGCVPKRVEVIPLAYAANSKPSKRGNLPLSFTVHRPLNILFLGQIIPRKGIGPLCEAVKRTAVNNLPVRFTFVGTGVTELIEEIRLLPNTRYYGHVSSQSASEFYKCADIFILPTFSDGFALTQLEAQFHGLPIIASRYCGDVVVPNRNGILLEEVTGSAIFNAINDLCNNPLKVMKLAEGSMVEPKFSLDNIGSNYVTLARALIRRQ